MRSKTRTVQFVLTVGATLALSGAGGPAAAQVGSMPGSSGFGYQTNSWWVWDSSSLPGVAPFRSGSFSMDSFLPSYGLTSSSPAFPGIGATASFDPVSPYAGTLGGSSWPTNPAAGLWAGGSYASNPYSSQSIMSDFGSGQVVTPYAQTAIGPYTLDQVVGR